MEHSKYDIIQIDEHLTSYTFYQSLLSKLHIYARQAIKKDILFDFSDTKSVSPLVIPNLLCIGYIIKENYHHTPLIFVPDNSDSDKIRSYLHDIDFVDIARRYDLFAFTPSIDYGYKRSIISKECLTHEFGLEFDTEDKVRNEVSRCYGNFFRKHLSSFSYELSTHSSGNALQENYIAKNLIQDVCSQLIHNSISHGNCFAFMTAQINYSKQKIFLSISDCGIGFKQSINSQIAHNDPPFQSRDKQMSSELEAIANAIFARADEENNSQYGLYPLTKHVLSLGGIMRFHSVNTQLILTSRLLAYLDIASSNKKNVSEARDSFLDLLESGNCNDYNIYTNLKFGGSHTEVELPVMRGEA